MENVLEALEMLPRNNIPCLVPLHRSSRNAKQIGEFVLGHPASLLTSPRDTTSDLERLECTHEKQCPQIAYVCRRKFVTGS